MEDFQHHQSHCNQHTNNSRLLSEKHYIDIKKKGERERERKEERKIEKLLHIRVILKTLF